MDMLIWSLLFLNNAAIQWGWASSNPLSLIQMCEHPTFMIVHVVVKVEEADHIYLLMKEDYRISRNVRLAWFLSKLNQIICPASKPEVVSFLSCPHDGPAAPRSRLAPFYYYPCICHR